MKITPFGVAVARPCIEPLHIHRGPVLLNNLDKTLVDGQRGGKPRVDRKLLEVLRLIHRQIAVATSAASLATGVPEQGWELAAPIGERERSGRSASILGRPLPAQ